MSVCVYVCVLTAGTVHRLLALTHCLSPDSYHPSLPVPTSPLHAHDWCHGDTTLPKPWSFIIRDEFIRKIHMRLWTLQSFQVYCLTCTDGHYSGSLSSASEHADWSVQVFKTFPWSFSSWPKCQTVSANTSRVLPGCCWFTHLHSQSTLIPLRRASVLSKRSSPPFWWHPPLKRPSSCFRSWVAVPRCVSAEPTNTDHHSWTWGRREGENCRVWMKLPLLRQCLQLNHKR